MTREATEKCLAKPTARAMRAAALRLAREGAGEDTDPSQAYGCVEWFRYDVTSPPQKMATAPSPAAAPPGTGLGATPPAH
jgi:hypothetical protein